MLAPSRAVVQTSRQDKKAQEGTQTQEHEEIEKLEAQERIFQGVQSPRN